MPALSNPKHERFAQELAKGKTADEAYQEAGYKPNDGNCIRLKGNERVQARVSEIQERAAYRCEVTVAGLTADLLRLAKMGEAFQTESGVQASRASLMDAAKLNGFLVDKQMNANVSIDDILKDLDGNGRG